MKLLRLTPALKSTSAPYNQFSLGFKETIDQVIFSLHAPHDVDIDDKLEVIHGSGSIFKSFFVLKQLVKKNKFDVIHIHNGVTGLLFILAIFPFNLGLLNKSVFTLHNSWYVLKTRNQFLDFFVMLFSKRVCTCGLSSYNSIPTLIKIIIGKKMIPVVNGFNHKRIDEVENKKIKNQYFNSEDHVRILYVGALNHIKNQIALLKVLKKIKINAEIVFLGDGANKERLIEFSKSINSSIKICFKGLVSRDTAIDHMLEADVCISLSKGEGLPIAILESMYAGCFMILSSIPPHLEVSPPKDRCIFVNEDKESEIVNAVNYVSENLEQIKVGKINSKEYSITNFSVNKMLESYNVVYESLCVGKN